MTRERTIEVFTADWQGIALSVSYETSWLDLECGFRADRARHSDLMPPVIPI